MRSTTLPEKCKKSYFKRLEGSKNDSATAVKTMPFLFFNA